MPFLITPSQNMSRLIKDILALDILALLKFDPEGVLVDAMCRNQGPSLPYVAEL